jgi:HSP20 family protein
MEKEAVTDTSSQSRLRALGERRLVMTLVKKEVSRPIELWDQVFGRWLDWPGQSFVMWPESTGDFLKVEQFREDQTVVVRVEIPGIDPEKDAEITVIDGRLHLSVERRFEEAKEEGKDYLRREFRYGSFTRDLPLPEGTCAADIRAAYKDGILEIRIPVPVTKTEEATKIPVTAG